MKWNPFAKKDSTPKLPERLHFKDSTGAFEYACRFFKSDIYPKQALTGLIVDSASQGEREKLMLAQFSKGENNYTAYLVRVAAADGGFVSLGVCYKKTATLRPGDLVFWVPISQDNPMAILLADQRQAWIGALVAKLAPSYSMATGSFEIVERYA